MRLTLSTTSGDIFNLVVEEDLTFEGLKARCASQSSIPADEMAILHEGRKVLGPKKTMRDLGFKQDDVLLIQRQSPPTEARQTTPSMPAPPATHSGPAIPKLDFGAIQVPTGKLSSQQDGSSSRQTPAAGGSSAATPVATLGGMPYDPAALMRMLLNDHQELAVLKENNPRLAEALLSRDEAKFRSVLYEQYKQREEKERRQIRLVNADPFNTDAQKQIEEEIRLKNVDHNMEVAIEHSPESFAQVVMLYISCKVNGHHVKAFVDSGAQATIMSQACAERCNIMRLVDARFAGIAKGVGTQKIIGRVHLGQIQIEKDFLQSSFSILEDQPMDMLLGLDMLRRHQCIIDLQQNLFIISSTGTKTKFLTEAQLPDYAKLNKNDMQLEGPEEQQLAKALSESMEKPTFPEVNIKQLTDMGFSRDQAVQALGECNGDTNRAAAVLLAKSFKPS